MENKRIGQAIEALKAVPAQNALIGEFIEALKAYPMQNGLVNQVVDALKTVAQSVAIKLTVPLKRTYTSGEVALICNVAPRTVCKWCDAGLLIGYRLPGSKDRRFPRECVVAFLKSNGLPIPEGFDPEAEK